MTIKMKIHTFVAYILMTAAAATGYAQQDLMLSQEIISRINKNPAGTGNSEDVNIFLHGRMQWIGVDNAPKTGVLNVCNYIESIHSGVGLSLAYDKFGVGHSNTDAKLVYSYHVDINDNLILSMGLSGGVFVSYFNPYDNTVEDERKYMQASFMEDKETAVSPDFNVGVEISQRAWTFGASVTHVANGEAESFSPQRHFYAYLTSLIPTSERFALGPTVCYMHRSRTDVMEVGSMAFYDRFLWGGLIWRPDINNTLDPSILAFSLGFEWNKFRMGYSYDLGIGSNCQLPPNTHELTLSVSIGKGKKHY